MCGLEIGLEISNVWVKYQMCGNNLLQPFCTKVLQRVL